MKKSLKLAFIIGFFSCFISSFSQSKHRIDSLINILKTQREDTIKVKTLNELAWEFGKINASKARNYAIQAKELSDSLTYERGRITSIRRLGDIAIYQKEYDTAENIYLKVLNAELRDNHLYGIGRAQNQLGEIYRNKGDLKKALKYSLKALRVFKNLNNTNVVALVSNNIGAIHKSTGNYDDALSYFLESLEARQKLGDKRAIGFSFLNLGSLSIELENYNDAIEYFKESKIIFEKLNDKYELAKIYNNLGIVFFKMKDYNMALYYYKKCLFLEKQIGLKNKDEDPYNNIGNIYYKRNKLDSALVYYLKSDSIHRNNNRGSISISGYNNIGNIYQKKGNYKKAIVYYENVLASPEISDKKTTQLEVLNSLSNSYAKIHQYNIALKYSNRYIHLRKSIENTLNNALKLKANYEEQQKKNSILEVENKRKNTFIYSLIIVLILILLLFFSIINAAKQRQKVLLGEQKIEDLLKEQESKSMDAMIKGQEEEQKRIARDLHDRLGSILAMVKIHFKSVEDNINRLKVDNKRQYEKANNLLDSACEEVRKIAHNITSGVLMKFGLVAALEDLKETLEETGRVDVDFIAHGLDDRLDNNVEITIYRIIQELVSNILKHAKAKEITIQLIKNKSKLNIIIEDDGIGFNMQNNKNSGMGLKNVASRVDALSGEFHVDSTPGNGTTVAIDIPVSNN